MEEFVVALAVESRFRVKAVVGKGYFDFSSVIKELRGDTPGHLVEQFSIFCGLGSTVERKC